MIDWAALLIQVALTVVGAVAAERIKAIRKRPELIGLLFGSLSAVAQFSPVAEIGFYDISVKLNVVSPIIAGFFYGPIAGFVSGGIACLVGFLDVLDGVSMLLVICCASGMMATALYAVIVGKWVFCGKFPPVCTAIIAAAYGVVVYLTVGSLFGLARLPIALEIIFDSVVPMMIGTCLSAGLVVVICGTWRGWWRGFFSPLNLAFLFVGVAISITSTVIVLNAKEEGEAIVRQSVADLTAEEETQTRYMLHESAVNISEAIAGINRMPTDDELRGFARMFGVDGISVVNTNGIVAASSESGILPGQHIVHKPKIMRQYLELCEGERQFLCQPFEPYGANTNDWVKYFSLPLSDGGFLRLACLWSRIQMSFPQYIRPSLEGRYIGESGYYLIFNEHGVLDLPIPDHPETKGMSFNEVGLDEKALARPYDSVFRARILGTLCRCVTFEPFGGYRLYAVLPLAETQGPALAIATIVALVLMAICIAFRIVHVRFQQAQEKIDLLRAEEERHRAEDLALARNIQRAELRTDGTEGEGYCISSLMNAAREVGGDFYDYYELPDGRLVVTIADVSGKGIPAAFFMMKSRVTLKSSVHSADSLAVAMTEANARLSMNNSAEMFVTAWVGVYDRRDGTIEFVSAGHNPPLVCRRNGSVEWLQAPRSPAMGNFADLCYRSATIRIETGDRLFLYTDGVTEAMNARGELFGNERLLKTLEKTRDPLVPAVEEAVRNFANGAEQADDITMLELAIRQEVVK